jgi:glycosyltransferase involved in cell wall biosynthesis
VSLPPSILLVNTADQGGGAEKMAATLRDGLCERGFPARLAVGFRRGDDPGTLALSRQRDQAAHNPAAPAPPGPDDRKWALRAGVEDFFYPASWDLLMAADERPALLHFHNLHGGYFDLRALAWLSRRVPTLVTLHDQWLLTGHCAHPVGCERWREGCGDCPDLALYPPLPADNTANNHRRKAEILADCRLYVTAPCQWLLDRARAGILGPAMLESRCIPNGIDLSRFCPGDRGQARQTLDLPADAFILLFVANGGRRNIWRDYPAMLELAARLARRLPRPPLFVVVGGAEEEMSGQEAGVDFRMVPRAGPDQIADYQRAADLYLHIARADTFPTVVLEAMACGTPVMANRVGGIPEQVIDLQEDAANATGVLFPTGDLDRAADLLAHLAASPDLCRRMGENARRHASRFDAGTFIDRHIDWYRAILNDPPALEAW